MEFPEGVGVQAFVGGVWIFSGTTQLHRGGGGGREVYQSTKLHL